MINDKPLTVRKMKRVFKCDRAISAGRSIHACRCRKTLLADAETLLAGAGTLSSARAITPATLFPLLLYRQNKGKRGEDVPRATKGASGNKELCCRRDAARHVSTIKKNIAITQIPVVHPFIPRIPVRTIDNIIHHL
jgi:hypothetical protein